MPALTTDQVQTYGLWIQTGAIVVSAIGVGVVAYTHRIVARRRATLDIIIQEQTHDGMLATRQKFIELRDAGHLVAWAAPEKAAAPETTVIRSTLNRYELVAIGISEKTINLRIYRRWCRTTLVRDWTACKPFVTQLRQNTNNPKFFCEIEALAKKWARGAERDHV
jgi:hypothetical protein